MEEGDLQGVSMEDQGSMEEEDLLIWEEGHLMWEEGHLMREKELLIVADSTGGEVSVEVTEEG